MNTYLINIGHSGDQRSEKASDFSTNLRYGDHRKRWQEFVKLLAQFKLDAKYVLVRYDGYESSNTLTQAEAVSMKIVWEKRSRAAAAILFLVCSMPRAVMDLMSFSSDSDTTVCRQVLSLSPSFLFTSCIPPYPRSCGSENTVNPLIARS